MNTKQIIKFGFEHPMNFIEEIWQDAFSVYEALWHEKEDFFSWFMSLEDEDQDKVCKYVEEYYSSYNEIRKMYRIYGVDIDDGSVFKETETCRMPYVYAHGELEQLNGYDIVEGNVYAMSLLTLGHRTIETGCVFVTRDGKEYKAMIGGKKDKNGYMTYYVVRDNEEGKKELMELMNN